MEIPMEEMNSVWGKHMPGKKAKIRVCAICHGELFFLEISVRPVFCKKKYMLSNMQLFLHWFIYSFNTQRNQCNKF